MVNKWHDGQMEIGFCFSLNLLACVCLIVPAFSLVYPAHSISFQKSGCGIIFVASYLVVRIDRITFTGDDDSWVPGSRSCFLGGCSWMTLSENIWHVFFQWRPIILLCLYLQGFNAGYKRQTSASKWMAWGMILLNSYQHSICSALHMHVEAYLRIH